MQPIQALHPKLFIALTHAVGAATVALALGAFYLLAYRPMLSRETAHEHRTEQLIRLLDNSIEVRRQHVQLKKQIDELTSRIQRTRQLTPTQSMEAEFLASASQIAAEEQLEIADYSRGKVRHLLNHSELDITISGIGSYTSICQFLSSMEQTPRAKRVRSLDVRSSDDTYAYPIEITYTLYFGLKGSASLKQLARQ